MAPGKLDCIFTKLIGSKPFFILTGLGQFLLSCKRPISQLAGLRLRIHARVLKQPKRLFELASNESSSWSARRRLGVEESCEHFGILVQFFFVTLRANENGQFAMSLGFFLLSIAVTYIWESPPPPPPPSSGFVFARPVALVTLSRNHRCQF